MGASKKLYLEFVRGGAAIFVFISHIFELIPSASGERIKTSHVGTDSVMIFFILSGCVINFSQTRRPKTKSEFFINRLLRLYPQFIVGVLLGILVLYLLHKDLPAWPALLGNIFMLSTLQGFIVKSLDSNSPIWSLSFEMVFYLIFILTIGRNNMKRIWLWFALALVAMPFFYLPVESGVLAHFIAILSFSSIWLIGYLVYEYRSLFYADIYTALLSAGLLPLVSRLHLISTSYDPFKYLLFAIVAIPFFRFCLQLKPAGKKVNIIYYLLAYVLLVALIFLDSGSRLSSKLFYSILPAVLTGTYFFINHFNLKSRVVNFINNTGAVTGKYSYSLYIVHFPILYFFSEYFKNKIVYVAACIIAVTLVTYVLESVFQPGITRLFKPAKQRPQVAPVKVNN